MHILITGGTGLIGKAFIDAFSKYQFTVVSRTPDTARDLLPRHITLIESLSELNHLNTFDAVINLAGEPIIGKRWSNAQKNQICQSRWQTTKELVALFRISEKPPTVFLSGSAIGFYGKQMATELTEFTPPPNKHQQSNDFPMHICVNWEAIANEATPYTRVVLLRTGIVLSTQGGALTKMLPAFKCHLGGKIGNGQQIMSWIHITDMVNAINHLLQDQAITGAVNLTAPEPVSNQEFTGQLAKAVNRIAVLPVPVPALKLMLGEAACLLLDSQKVLPKKLLSSGFQFEHKNLPSALAQLL